MSDSDDFDFDVDEAGLDELNQLEVAYASGLKLPPRTTVNKPGLVQRDLFGAPVVHSAAPVAGPSRAKPNSTSFGTAVDAAKVKIVKRWDRESFAKHGWSKRVAAVARKAAGIKSKGKAKAGAWGEYDDFDEEEMVMEDEDDVEEGDEDGPTFFVDTTYDPHAPPLPMKCEPDPEAIKTWVYPVQADKPLRTYQYNIVHQALFENTLVSLPTGLGKTFIAACIMLNFYRWFPRGKIIFLAPSRPLVRQQIVACHYTTGIPQVDCVELTGHTPPKLRAIGWATKRVIYSTPQTVENDLRKGRLDPRDVTCVVVDEAHRASGDYAYCGVVRYMMSRNPYFRILALTATPGSKGEAVQEVIDNLHIGNIEVRTDKSFDIRQYMHKKSYDLTILPLGPELSKMRDRWGELMQTYIRPLCAAKLIYEAKPEMLSSYPCTLAYKKVAALPGGPRANGRFYPIIKTLDRMCRAMEYLIIQSVTEFETHVKDMKVSGPKTLTEKSEFKEIVQDLKMLRSKTGYVGHPKMERLRSMCWDHFKKAEHEVDELTGQPRQTRVMVFCNYRAVVDEIVICLNRHKPLIKATPFIGQGTAKGVKGMSQKDQIEAIRKFKKGEYNVLVASSIGEEGLDIGEIDLIVCYEANKSPIRMLQRVGRTGRARDGHIIVLMTEGREEKNWDKAQEAYNDVQNALVTNRVFELYADGERLVPKEVKPVVDKITVEAKPLKYEAMVMSYYDRGVTSSKPEKKAKVVKDAKRNMPKNAFAGFRTAAELKDDVEAEMPESPGRALRKRKQEACLSASQEEYLYARWALQGGRPPTFDPSRLPFDRGRSGAAHVIPRHGKQHEVMLTSLRVTASLDDSQPDALDKWHADMSMVYDPSKIEPWDSALRRGRPAPGRTRFRRPLPPSSERFEDPLFSSMSLPAPTGFAPTSSLPLPDLVTSPARPPAVSARPPAASARRTPPPAVEAPRSPVRLSPSPPPPPPKAPMKALIESQRASLDYYGVLTSDEDEDGGNAVIVVDEPEADRPKPLSRKPPAPAPEPLRPAALEHRPSSDYSALFDDNDDDDCIVFSDSELLNGAVIKKFAPAPALAKMAKMAKIEESSSPIRPPGYAAARGANAIVQPTVSSDGVSTAAPQVIPLNRLRRGVQRSRAEIDADQGDLNASDSSSPPRQVKKVKRAKLNAKTAARTNLFDVEAVNSSASGTEASSEAYDSEDSDDRRFVAGDQDEVDQDSSSQARFYRESLMTQAPEGFAPRLFGRHEGGPEGPGFVATPATPMSQPDDWSYDSFCARDDEEIEMESSSQPL